MRRYLVVMVTVAMAVAGTSGSSAGAAASGVSGPVVPAAAAQSHWVGLESSGLTEDEWFLDGVATAYAPVGTWTANGVWPAQPTTHADFRTRLLVRRPTDPAAFNGTVVVEWDNVSAGFDTGPTWTAAIDELLRRGYAYVGVSAQKVGVEQMKTSNAARYGSLNHPGDAYSYDIFTQAARALRGQPGALLLPGLPVQKLIAVGESQSAARMVTYINAVQPLARAYNGYLVYSRLAGAASIADGVGMPANPVIRADTARIIDVQTEGDLVVLRSHLARQADSGRFRLWEVAGGSHADEHTLNPKNPPVASVAGAPCEFRMNSARTHFVVGAAVHALDRWTRGLGAPGRAPRLRLTPDAETAPDPIVRDRDGLARGGIRLPQISVPTARVDGLVNPAAPGAPDLFVAFCRLFGRTIPFDRATLDARYPSRVNYALTVYWYAVVDANRGFLNQEDPPQLLWEAATSDIGT